jgi:hypothetical protein
VSSGGKVQLWAVWHAWPLVVPSDASNFHFTPREERVPGPLAILCFVLCFATDACVWQVCFVLTNYCTILCKLKVCSRLLSALPLQPFVLAYPELRHALCLRYLFSASACPIIIPILCYRPAVHSPACPILSPAVACLLAGPFLDAERGRFPPSAPACP